MPNTLKVGDKVRSSPKLAIVRTNGTVKYVACVLATAAGGKTCDKKTCNHTAKDYVWVEWVPKSIFSYHYTELMFDAAPTSPNETSKPTCDETKKDEEYIDKAKAEIKAITKSGKAQLDWFRAYNGFTKFKYDRQGRPYIQETELPSAPPIKNEELDFDVYSGIKKGSIRKQA